MHDLVVAGGTVVDGTGAPTRRADIGIDGERIAAIGTGLRGRTTIDATGLVVTPGFIDIHTHYDPQVLWDPHLTPSSHLGVTSVVAGNCGFSLAPCAPEGRGTMLRTLEAVEDMAVPVLQAGIDWSFTTYPEYLARVAAHRTRINFGGYVGHTAVRLFVMGEAAYERTATDDELAAMVQIVRDALLAGALGFSTDRSPVHRADGGRPVPSVVATMDEVRTLCSVTAALGRGVVHCNPGESYQWLYDLGAAIHRPITWTSLLAFAEGDTSRSSWRDKLAHHHAHGTAVGSRVHPQVTPRPITASVSLDNPAVFTMVPAFGEVTAVPHEQRRRTYADPAWRARAWAELASGRHVSPRWDVFVVGECPHDPSLVGRSLAALAAERGTNPLEVWCSLAEGDAVHGGTAAPSSVSRVQLTYANDDVAAVTELLRAPGTVLGLSDAGAHVGQLCDATLPLDFLGTWVRDRELMSIEAGVHKLTGEPAALLELRDRGTLQPGAFADIAVLDWHDIDAGPVRRVTDLPGGGERLVADAPRGVVHVLVNGTAIRRDHQNTELGALPGRPLDNGGPT